MGMIYTSVATLFVVLIILNFSIAESEVNGIELVEKSVKVVVKNDSSVDEKVKSGVEESKLSGNENSSKKLESKEVENEKKGGKGVEFQEGGKKDSGSDGEDAKNGEGVVNLPLVKKESSRGEECDSSSISCTDDKKALVACLRVPGNDPAESPEFSLLIQNKGKGTLAIKISAPNFVRLEKNQIQIQENEDKKVRVYVTGRGTDNFIVLTAGNGNCSLDFKEFIVHTSTMEGNYASKFSYIHLYKRTPILGLIFLAVLLLIASPWMCIKFRRRHLTKDGGVYEKLNMELPVSVSEKTESGVNDEWNDSWGDSWDDEEAPKTPSMPITPSLSSKGIASRRLSKDGWKD